MPIGLSLVYIILVVEVVNECRVGELFLAVYDIDGNAVFNDSYCDIYELINSCDDSYTLVSYDNLGFNNVINRISR